MFGAAPQANEALARLNLSTRDCACALHGSPRAGLMSVRRGASILWDPVGRRHCGGSSSTTSVCRAYPWVEVLRVRLTLLRSALYADDIK